jgi:hypothetical protein
MSSRSAASRWRWPSSCWSPQGVRASAVAPRVRERIATARHIGRMASYARRRDRDARADGHARRADAGDARSRGCDRPRGRREGRALDRAARLAPGRRGARAHLQARPRLRPRNRLGPRTRRQAGGHPRAQVAVRAPPPKPRHPRPRSRPPPRPRQPRPRSRPRPKPRQPRPRSRARPKPRQPRPSPAQAASPARARAPPPKPRKPRPRAHTAESLPGIAPAPATTGFRWRRLAWGATVLLVLGLLVFLATRVPSATVPVLTAFILAYLLDPVVDFFEARRVNRSAAILIILALSLLVGAAAILLLGPRVLDELRQVPDKLRQAAQHIQPWLEAQLGAALPPLARRGRRPALRQARPPPPPKPSSPQPAPSPAPSTAAPPASSPPSSRWS